MFFSPLKAEFYPLTTALADMPADIITVTQSEYQSAINRVANQTLVITGGKLYIL